MVLERLYIVAHRGNQVLEHHPKYDCLFACLLACYRLSLCLDGFTRVYKPLDF